MIVSVTNIVNWFLYKQIYKSNNSLDFLSTPTYSKNEKSLPCLTIVSCTDCVVAYLDVCVDSGPPDGVLVPQQHEGARHHGDVLQHLLLHLGQRGHVREVALVLARHPLGGLQVRDLPPDQVGEHAHRLVRLVVLLEDGLVRVGDAVCDQHDGLVSLGSNLNKMFI